MKTPESYEKDDIDAYLESIPACVFKPTTGGFGKSGCPDRLVCIDGMFWGIEVKREGKEPTVLQWIRIQSIQAAGGMAIWGTAKKVIEGIEAWRNIAGLLTPDRS